MYRFVLLIATVFASLQLAATDPSELRQQVMNAVNYPSHLTTYNEVEVVLVEYTILEDGTLRINSTNASDERFRNYVESQLKQLVLSGVEEELTQSVKFSFVRQ
jgi:hypothetical protein